MLRIIAMVGVGEASAHLRTAVEGVAVLQFVRDLRVLRQHLGRDRPDVLVLGIMEAELPGVGVVVRDTIARQPGIRVFLLCHMDGPDMHALARVRHLDCLDVILPRHDSSARTRGALLADNPAHVADMCVRRLVCPNAPLSLSHLVDWCTHHDGAARPSVRALAAVACIRPETLARRFTALGVCPPNHMISWVVVLRAKARLDRPRTSLEAVAYELGLASGGSLAHLIRRRTGLKPHELREQTLEDLAARAVFEMFGVRPQRASGAPPAQPNDRRARSVR